MNATFTLDHGHEYGRPFGFRKMAAAMKLVSEGKIEIVSQNKWAVRGPKGGLCHGYETTFRETNQ